MHASPAIASTVALLEEFKRLRDGGLSGNQAAQILGRSAAWFSLKIPGYDREGIAALAPKAREWGAQRRLFTDLPSWFIPAARFFYLLTNLSETRGSVPEAVRRTISLPICPPAVQKRLTKICAGAGWRPSNGENLPSCPPALRESILARAKAGQPMLPASLTRQIAIAAPFVKQSRNATDAGLDYLSAHGTQMWLRHAETGEKAFIRSGDVFESDDATVNFPVCIPWEIRGCPCSERHGVKVGRFQWLVAIDVGSRKILGFSYTARPRGSYRGEDVTSLMRTVVKQHGVPRFWRLEKGTFASHLVTNAIASMGSQRLEVHSPHSKPFIEGLFNKLWTKLAAHFPDASVGRFQGEGEDASKLLAACTDGQRDPRLHFPMLADALTAFHAVIDEHNASPIRSENYGTWVPDDRWLADTTARPLRKLAPEMDWLFAPVIRTWKVKGNSVGGRVPLMEGLSVPYIFSAPWLLEFHRAQVRCHFDPSDLSMGATVVLAQPWLNHRAGEVLGVAHQVNQTTVYVQAAMGWGNGQDRGLDAIRQSASALRREVRGIIGRKDTAAPVAESERRDGLGNLTRLTRGVESPAMPAPAPAMPPPEPKRHAARIGKIARLPFNVREELNEKMRDGHPYKGLVDWLNSLPEVREAMAEWFKGESILDCNLSRWRKGGFIDWLSEQRSTSEDHKKSTPNRTIRANRVEPFRQIP